VPHGVLDSRIRFVCAERMESAAYIKRVWAGTVLDPVFEQLARVETEEMLKGRIEELFRFIDEDNSEMVCDCLLHGYVLVKVFYLKRCNCFWKRLEAIRSNPISSGSDWTR